MSLAEEQQMQKHNSLVSDWTAITRQKVRASFRSYSKGSGSGGGEKQIRTSIGKNSGLAERISFKIPRHFVFFHKGVGRGRGINSGKTTPRPFLNEVLNEAVPDLRDGLVDIMQDTMINDSKILIR